ncbi:hypothetical protein MNBD_ALPHA12-2231 [hydrothermal vent metagenome]|uniref:DUF559 domain-containing protein n=1 Tax=hydrothermal vent metagenome TaxID=652676 RepID=A0A3B0UFY6_9ZZZZ
MNIDSPSSGALRHLLPRGEKEEKSATVRGGEREGKAELLSRPLDKDEGLSINSMIFPSPLVGEGARRAGEGGFKAKALRLKGFSRSMRQKPTEAEKLLWRLLRNRRFANHKFRRQVALGPFIVDFLCYKAKLVVELDGSQHADCTKDVARDAWLQNHGFRVLRLWNNDLMLRQKSSLDAVWHALSNPKD